MNPADLLVPLSDCQWHSGETLAARFGVSRAAIWQTIRKLEVMGVQVYAVRGRGYRLPQSPEWLSPEAIREAAGVDAAALDIECVPTTVSTNEDVLNRSSLQRPLALLTEYQTGGRGRRGKSWQQSFAAGLCLSLGMDTGGTATGAGQLSMLPFAAGVSVVEALQGLGFQGLGLKWPNDLYCGRAKLGGFLIEHRGEIAGEARTVIGLGANVRSTPTLEVEGAVVPACLADAWGRNAASMPDRSMVAGRVIAGILAAIRNLAQTSRNDIIRQWKSYDVLLGEQVKIVDAARTLVGRYKGVDADGALQLELPSGENRRFHAADVSLRDAG